MDLGVIIVLKNKASILKNLHLQKTSLAICIINNGSGDQTITELKKLEKRAPFKLFILDVKRDKGFKKAIKAGKRFFENTLDIDTTTFIDGNTFSDLEELNQILEKISKKEITIESTTRIKQIFSFSYLQIV